MHRAQAAMHAIRLIAAALVAQVLSDAASASVVRPCREPLEGARHLGDARWVETCAATRGAAAPATLQACRKWLEACRKNPQHPLPRGTNNF